MKETKEKEAGNDMAEKLRKSRKREKRETEEEQIRDESQIEEENIGGGKEKEN